MKENEQSGNPLANPLSLLDARDDVALMAGASGTFGHGCAKAPGATGTKLMLVSGSQKELEKVASDVRSAGHVMYVDGGFTAG